MTAGTFGPAASLAAGEAAVQRALAPLEPVRALREGAELVHTLQLYLLDTDRSVTQTAQALFVHKNTVKYRLQQLGARLGHPVAKFPEAFGLYTACAVERLLEG